MGNLPLELHSEIPNSKFKANAVLRYIKANADK